MGKDIPQGVEEAIKQLSDKFAEKHPKDIGSIVAEEISKIRQLQDKRVEIEYHCCFTFCGEVEDISGSGKILGNGLFPNLYFEFEGTDGDIYDDCAMFNDNDLELRKGFDWLQYLKPMLDAFSISAVEWGLFTDANSIIYLNSNGDRIVTDVSGVTTLVELIESLGIKVKLYGDITCEDLQEYDDEYDSYDEDDE